MPLGEPLLEIGDPQALEIVADLLSTDAVRVPAGAAVLIEQWGGGEPLTGEGAARRALRLHEESRRSASRSSGSTSSSISSTRPPPPAHSATATASRSRIVVWSDDAVLSAPVGSLFRRGDGWAAFVVEAGRARLQPVQIGQRNDTSAEITGGLTRGQAVVMHPPDTLADGIKVVVRPPT